jgi:hypothetical protein
VYWAYGGANPSYFSGSAVMGGLSGMANAQSSSTQVVMDGCGSFGEKLYLNTMGSGGQHNNPAQLFVYWYGQQGFNGAAPSTLSAQCNVYILTT